MPTVEATFTDPDAIQRTTPKGTWFLTGTACVEDSSIEALVVTGDAELFCRNNRDALVVFVASDNGSAHTLEAWRAIFSGSELFLSIRPEGDIVVSDHFVNVLAAMPPHDRLPDEQILVSHYLFRKPFGPLTYSRNVTRLSHAEHLHINVKTGHIQSEQFDTVADESERRPPEEYIAAIDAAIANSFSCSRANSPAAMMFSGGVDSTLIMTYLDESVTPITFVPDTPEFGEETNYARRAASLLGVEIEEIPRAESRFVELLELTTSLAGTPVFDEVNPHLGGLISEQPYRSFFTGEGADSAFGMSLKLARFASWFRFRGVHDALQATASHVPGTLGFRMRQVEPIAAQLARDPMDPDGFAANVRSFGDTSLFETLVPLTLVREAKIAQLDYVGKRISLTGSDRSMFLAHIESAHWMTILGNPMMIQRLVAHAGGKTVLAPFLDDGVLSELVKIPVEDRYVRGLRAKWLLKDLLAQRLDGYPTNQRKKATALPLDRFYASGPLTDFWDQYDVPDIFVNESRDALVSKPSTTTWNAITYAVWEQRVAKNQNLQPFKATVAGSFTIGTG